MSAAALAEALVAAHGMYRRSIEPALLLCQRFPAHETIGLEQVYNEIRNAHAHLAWAVATDSSGQTAKIRNHLLRCALDVRKILWHHHWPTVVAQASAAQWAAFEQIAAVSGAPASEDVLAEWDAALRAVGMMLPEYPSTDPVLSDEVLMALYQVVQDVALAHREEVRLTLLVCRRACVINEFHALFIRLLMDAVAACREDSVTAVASCRQAVADYRQQLMDLECQVLLSSLVAAVKSAASSPDIDAIKQALAAARPRRPDYLPILRGLIQRLGDAGVACPLRLPAENFHRVSSRFSDHYPVRLPDLDDCVVWFLDLVGSSDARRSLDERSQVLQVFHAAVSQAAYGAIDQRRLLAVNTWGDGAMAAFSGLESGMAALRVVIEQFRQGAGDWTLRGGVCRGPLQLIQNPIVGADVTGDTVVIAARLEPSVPKPFWLGFHGIDETTLIEHGWAAIQPTNATVKKAITTTMLHKEKDALWSICAWSPTSSGEK